jgi:hypothetical protein
MIVSPIESWIALIVGLTLPLSALFLKARAGRQHGWTRVPGVITKSKMTTYGEDVEPEIEFEYCVDGTKYVGSKVRSLLVRYNWTSLAKRICTRYPVGSTPQVFVNPADPSDAVLEPGGDRFSVPVAIVLGIGIWIFTLLWMARVSELERSRGGYRKADTDH